MRKIDYLIIGAGPAGCAAGIVLRKRGKECVIVEKNALPRTKLCAGLFTRKSQNVLEHILDEATLKECYSQCLMSKESKFVMWNGYEPFPSCNLDKPIILIDRPKFDYFLVKHFMTLGGEVIEGNGLKAIDFNNKTVTLMAGDTIEYNHLIAADGANSVVEKAASVLVDGFKRKTESSLCLEVNVDREDLDIEGVNVYLNVVPGSYAWAFAKGKKVCLGLVKMLGTEFSVQNALLDFMRQLGVKNMDKYPVRGAMIPFENVIPKPVIEKSEVMFVGDAAGFVEPLTGEGIYYALQSGVYAGESHSVEEYLEKTKYLRVMIDKGEYYQKFLSKPWAMKIFYKYAPRHTKFMEYFYSKRIEEGCLDSFIEICWKYKAQHSHS